MIADAIEALVDRPGFKVKVFAGADGGFEIGASDDAALTALLLRRARARAGLSLAEVAARLGAKSVNSYARYEQGKSVPSVRKLSQLYAAVSPKADFVLSESRA
jgi:predicted transcriptional regulator